MGGINWSSVLGTAVGCVLGWYVIPDIVTWIKGKRGVDEKKNGNKCDSQS